MKKLAMVLTVLLAAGCATRTTSSGAAAAVAPQLSVERFLQAANDRDFASMARLFGTQDGPIGDTGSSFGCFWKKIGTIFGGESCQKWRDVELRMDAIARILQHRDYRIVRETQVPGRATPATRIGVDLDLAGNRRASDVGFVVVRSDGAWLVEQVELDKVTSAGG